MKTSFYLSMSLMAAMMVLVGCGEKSSKPSTGTNTTSVLTAPVDYLGAVGKAQQVATKTIDTTSLNAAIQMFNEEEGRYPKDLNELVEKKTLREIPKAPYGMKLVYDAQTGKVTVEKQ
jgi:hypothetical protein